MRLFLFAFVIAIIAAGCSAAPTARQLGGMQEMFTCLQHNYANGQNPPRYFALFIPDHLTTRYTREKFRSDLVAASHASTTNDGLIYQDDWARLFIVPESYGNDSRLVAAHDRYRLLMDSFDQGKPGGLLAIRTQIAEFDRFRRLSGHQLREIDPWLQDMIRIPIDYLLIVDVCYQGAPDYLYAYDVSLTLKDIRNGRVDAFVRSTVTLPYRLK